MAQDFYIQQMQSMVQPMRDELTRIGFEELRTPEEVVEAWRKKGQRGPPWWWSILSVDVPPVWHVRQWPIP